MGISTPGESVSLERKIESSIFLCIPRDLNILGKSCTTFVIVKIVRNLSRGRSPCQRVNHVKSGVIYFSAFIFSYDTIHVSGTIHTWNRDLTFFIFFYCALKTYLIGKIHHLKSCFDFALVCPIEKRASPLYLLHFE